MGNYSRKGKKMFNAQFAPKISLPGHPRPCLFMIQKTMPIFLLHFRMYEGFLVYSAPKEDEHATESMWWRPEGEKAAKYEYRVSGSASNGWYGIVVVHAFISMSTI